MAKRKVDFTDVPEGGSSFKLIPEGNYPMVIDSVTAGTSKAGNDRDEVILKMAEGEFKGIALYHYITYTKASLGTLREFLVACGVDVPAKACSVDLEKYIGKTVMAEIYHEEFNGKTKCKIQSVFSVGESADDDGMSSDEADDELPI
jgi:hypothetical protein